MQDFETYIKSNYNVQNAVACGVIYTHTTRTSIDKKSKVSIRNHTINVKLTWFDKDNNNLLVEKLTFINDTLSKACEKQCKTISPTEVTNKFRVAKHDIVRLLIRAKCDKINDLQNDVNILHTYMGSNTDIIAPEMKNTIDITEPLQTTSRSKTQFEM